MLYFTGTAQQAYDNTNGRVVFSSGSYFIKFHKFLTDFLSF